MRAVSQAENRTKTERAVRLALGRHQIRREQDIPTIGVLVGDAEEAASAWRTWGREAGWPTVVRDVGGPPEDEEVPGTAILYVWRGEDLARQVEDLWRTLDAAKEDRRRPLALAVSPEAAERYLNGAPLDRARTFFAEGIVRLPQARRTGLPGHEDALAETEPTLIQSAPSLTQQALRNSTVAGFAAARDALHRVGAGEEATGEADRARSAAERFLADLLEELPETQGLFALNVHLPFFFGVKPAEVDLLAAGLRLAVEIDGYYHFRDPEGYRRDRRKDTLLQRQGYLVLRFLAEDVVTRLEEILEEIRSAVAFRRATRG